MFRKALRGLWRNANFMKLWIGQSLSMLGSELGQFATAFVAILTLHASASQVGLIVGTAGLPWILFGAFVGLGVDRFRRRPLLIGADLGRGILQASVPVAAVLGVLTIQQLYVVAFLAGTLTVLFETSYQSYLPSLVKRDELADGNGKLAISATSANVAGPGLAGGIVQALTAPIAVALDALSYFLSAFFLWRIDRAADTQPERRKTTFRGILDDLKEGYAHIWRHRFIRAFALSNASFMLFFTVIQAVLVVFMTRTLGLPPAVTGIVFTTGNIGTLIGAVFASRVITLLKPGRSIILSAVLRAIGIAAVPIAAFVGPLAIALLITTRFVHGFGWAQWGIHQQTARQLMIPDELRGRVNGGFLFLVRGSTSVGGYLGAGLAAAFGVVPTITIGSIGVLISCTWLFLPALWRMHTVPDETRHREQPAT